MRFQYTNLIKILECFILLTIAAAQEPCRTPDRENGFCVPYKECPFVMGLADSYGSYTRIPQHYLDYVFKSKCSTNNQPVRLCCKFTNFNPKPVTPTTMETVNVDSRLIADLDYTKDYKTQFNSQGLNILNELSCGNPEGNRVAGGNETSLGEYPWMVLLKYHSSSDEFKCGASLITNRFVLTAAHCVKRATDQVIGVRLGEHDLSTDRDCKKLGKKIICNPPVEDIGIDDIIIHPKYNERKRINDIALIKLNRNVQFEKHIKPICLPITQPSYEPDADDFYIAGWGSTEKGIKSKVLLKAQVFKKERSVCANVFRIEINQKHICAADLETGRDTCRGDSGGPLMAFNKYTSVKRFIQYGIVASGGVACNLSQGFPGIYTNILTYMPWITSNIVIN